MNLPSLEGAVRLTGSDRFAMLDSHAEEGPRWLSPGSKVLDWSR